MKKLGVVAMAITVTQLAITSSDALAGYVQRYMDAHGGCQSSPNMMEFLLEAHLPSYDSRFLGKKGIDWTDEDTADFRSVYADCLRRWPVELIHGGLRVGEPIVAPPGAVERKVNERVAEIAAGFIDPARAQQAEMKAAAAAKESLKRERARQQLMPCVMRPIGKTKRSSMQPRWRRMRRELDAMR